MTRKHRQWVMIAVGFIPVLVLILWTLIHDGFWMLLIMLGCLVLTFLAALAWLWFMMHVENWATRRDDETSMEEKDG